MEIFNILLSATTNAFLVGVLIWLFHRFIEKRDKEKQQYIDRRKEFEDVFFEYIKESKNAFISLRLLLENKQSNTGISEKQIVFKFLQNMQQACNIIQFDPILLDDYKIGVDIILQEYNTLSKNFDQLKAENQDIIHKDKTNKKIEESLNRIMEEFRSISIIYYRRDKMNKKTIVKVTHKKCR